MINQKQKRGKTMNKIGLQLYSVRDHFKTEEEARATFKKLKELGYDEAQTAGCYGFAYDKFREMANDAGIEIIGTHDNFEQMKKDIETVIENHKKLGTTNVGIGGAAFNNVEDCEQRIKEINEIAERLEKEGMKFTYHNHSAEFIKQANGKSMMEMLMEGTRDNVTICLDSYWVQNAGGDVCTWIEKLRGKLDIIHLKDMKTVKVDGSLTTPITEVGNGNMDFEKIIKTANECGVKYFCVEQDNCPYDFEPSLKASSDYLHTLINL